LGLVQAFQSPRQTALDEYIIYIYKKK
jgi:hypothetical protein